MGTDKLKKKKKKDKESGPRDEGSRVWCGMWGRGAWGGY